MQLRTRLSALVLGLASAASLAAPLPSPVVDATPASNAGSQTAVFAGGCFWGVEAVFRHTKGVTRAVSGYAGGAAKSPTYDTVSSGTTGHAESVEVTFDPAQISYGQLLRARARLIKPIPVPIPEPEQHQLPTPLPAYG